MSKWPQKVSRSENRLSDSLCSKSRRASDFGFPPREDTSWLFVPRIEWDPKYCVCYDLMMQEHESKTVSL